MTTGIQQETQVSKPRVTAVIPTRNRADLVCRAVESVLSQTMPELECVVVVDGPDPATSEALARITDSRLKVLALEHNVGGCEARNTGIREARGEWIALLDDDDEWQPTKIEKQLLAAEATTSKFALVEIYDRLTRGRDSALRCPDAAARRLHH